MHLPQRYSVRFSCTRTHTLHTPQPHYGSMTDEVASLKGRFDGFKVIRVLNESDRTKSMAVLGRWSNKPDQAVVLLSKRPFEASVVNDMLSDNTSTSLQFENDVYAKVTETAQHYTDIVAPYIRNLPKSRINWVYNILDKKAEADRLLFEDPDPKTGFMLHPDLKWDQKQTDGMYCIALCHRRDICSMRDLHKTHLPLLRNIRLKAFKAIEDRYSIPHDQIRAYVHYHPSYYHFHVHFMHVKVDAGPGMAAGKAHLLDDIIETVATASPDYYGTRTMHFTLGENDPLYQACFLSHKGKKQEVHTDEPAGAEVKIVKKSRIV